MGKVGRPLGSVRHVANDERDLAIIRRRMNGESLAQIAKDYDLSRERIRQLWSSGVARLSEEDQANAIILRGETMTTLRRKELRAERTQVGKKLKELFAKSFDRAGAMKIAGLTDEPNITSLSDLQFCELLFDLFSVRYFREYIRCSACSTIKPGVDFTPKVRAGERGPRMCRRCNTDRCRYSQQNNPHLRERQIDYARRHPNLQKLYQMRSRLRKLGRMDEMPPLPPPGTPDREIQVPLGLGSAYGLELWRARENGLVSKSEPQLVSRIKRVKELVNADIRQRKP